MLLPALFALALNTFAIRAPADGAVLADASALMVYVPEKYVHAYLVEYHIDGRFVCGATITELFTCELDVRRLEEGRHHLKAVLYDYLNAQLAEHLVAFDVKNTPAESDTIVALGNHERGPSILVRWAYSREDLATHYARVVDCTKPCVIPAVGKWYFVQIYLDASGRPAASVAPRYANELGDQ
jgi:hypothetical protein